jgi:hypothetical protein
VVLHDAVLDRLSAAPGRIGTWRPGRPGWRRLALSVGIADASAARSTDGRTALVLGMIHAMEVSLNSGAPIDLPALRRCSQRDHARCQCD